MEQLVNFIIRPPRAEYDPKTDLLEQEFMLKGKLFQRKDVEIKNSRGDVLQCSHYVPIVSPGGKPLPCVIYCHGNSGCRADASEAAIILLPSNITVFALDFSGSGISGGDHVTLGWNEKDDLRAVVNYLRADENVSLIGLWGRSMGAVTSLMYGAEDPSIAGMVLDSPFSDLVDLMMELVDSYRFRLPKFTVKLAIRYMQKTIQKKAKFDITDLNTIKAAQVCFVPALIGHAIDDDFIQPHHSDRILEAYMGDKNLIKFEGDHNSPRPQFYFDSINIFFNNVLQPPEDEVGESFFDFTNELFGKDVWRSMQELDYEFELSSENKESSTSWTVDAIRRVHSKRPMSRMEVPSHTSSKDEHRDHEDGITLSSSMISFELSNGRPSGPHVPATLNDDADFVEYELEDLTGFPSSAEEEERMLKEAVMVSLEDLEVTHPQNNDSHASSHATSKTISTASDDVYKPSKSESNSISVVRPHSLASQLMITASSVSASGTEFGNSASSCSVCSDSSASLQSSSETDISHNTKATLTVIRNPTANVLNGLIRRWDLNLFRNNRNR